MAIQVERFLALSWTKQASQVLPKTLVFATSPGLFREMTIRESDILWDAELLQPSLESCGQMNKPTTVH